MIPPSLQMQQALRMQQMMAQQQQKPQDPLMQALSKQAMMGDLLKQTATHKMKLLKIKQKYGGAMGGPAPSGPTAPPQGAY